MWVWETFCSIVSLNQLTSPGVLLHISFSSISHFFLFYCTFHSLLLHISCFSIVHISFSSVSYFFSEPYYILSHSYHICISFLWNFCCCFICNVGGIPLKRFLIYPSSYFHHHHRCPCHHLFRGYLHHHHWCKSVGSRRLWGINFSRGKEDWRWLMVKALFITALALFS